MDNLKVPERYNKHDYLKCVELLERTVNGKKNGTMLSETYDPNDPKTWGQWFVYYYYEWWNRFSWTLDGEEFRIKEVVLKDAELSGTIDFSGCKCLRNSIT